MRAGKVKASPIKENTDICAMTNCLLVAATAEEIAPFLHYYRNTKNPPDVDILITGPGLASTTYHLTRQLQLKRPDIVIQAGIAGCFDKQFTPGVVVAVKQDTIADLGVFESKKWKTLFDLGLLPANQFPFTNGWLVNPHTELFKTIRLKKVTGITVNQVTVSKQVIRFYQQRFDPVVESMEGAALHYVCLQENVPFLQVRAVSNYIGVRDKKKWKTKVAVINLSEQLTRLVQEL